MDYYQGLANGDRIRGGGSYVDDNNTGSEIHNFSIETIVEEPCFPSDKEDGYVDVCQGFVMCQSQIRIENLGASKQDDWIDGITVVWLARDPDHGKVYIVGWYKTARVYRHWQEPDLDTDRGYDDCYYNIQARAVDCTLLPYRQRRFHIPKASSTTSGGIGRSNVWFASDKKNEDIVRGVLNYIERYEADNKSVAM